MKYIDKIFPSIFFLIYTSFTLSQWQTLQISTSQNFFDVSIPSPSVVWAVGTDNSSMVRSTDGGQSWSVINSPFTQSYHVTAIDVNTAWVSGGNPNGRIFKTTNAGINWVEQTYSPSSFINNIHFFNANTGIFFTDQVSGVYGFFITRNGGNTWTRSPNSPTGTTVLTDNRMGTLDTNLVWYVHYTANGYRMLKLSGGLENTWVSLPFMNNSPMTNVIFKDMNTALATDGRQIQISTNGGMNWTIKNDSAISSTQIVIKSFIHIPSTDWIFIQSNNRVRISYDFCSIWEPLTIINGAKGYMRAYDTNSIYIAGDSGKIFKYNSDYIGIQNVSSEVPNHYMLFQNYPNPFNPVTNIEFSIPITGIVKISIYDILGKEVFNTSEFKNAGRYKLLFEGTNLSSGIYFYTLKSGTFIDTKKMILIK